MMYFIVSKQFRTYESRITSIIIETLVFSVVCVCDSIERALHTQILRLTYRLLHELMNNQVTIDGNL